MDLNLEFAYTPATGTITRYSTGVITGELHYDYRKGVKRIKCVRVTTTTKKYSAHRLAWFLMTGAWPTKPIDHIDGDPTNNKWENLREVTVQENNHNLTKLSRLNTTGFTGVVWDEKLTQFRAQIRCGNKTYYLGLHPTAEHAAHAVYAVKCHIHPTAPRRPPATSLPSETAAIIEATALERFLLRNPTLTK
jgi:hypothetical protein